MTEDTDMILTVRSGLGVPEEVFWPPCAEDHDLLLRATSSRVETALGNAIA
jgi:hypothetical protein